MAHVYGDQLSLFLSVRPGITSPAKARGRDQLTFRETLISSWTIFGIGRSGWTSGLSRGQPGSACVEPMPAELATARDPQRLPSLRE